MTVDRSELHELIDSLPADQRAFAWIGKGVAAEGMTDLSTNPKHLEGFGRESL